MLYVTDNQGKDILSTNAYGLTLKAKTYPALVNMGYVIKDLSFYDDLSYFLAYPEKRPLTESDITNAKIDYVIMVVEGLVMANV